MRRRAKNGDLAKYSNLKAEIYICSFSLLYNSLELYKSYLKVHGRSDC